MKYVKNTIGIRKQAEIEAAKMTAEQAVDNAEQLNATVDYIAMMCDVELPELPREGEINEPEI